MFLFSYKSDMKERLLELGHHIFYLQLDTCIAVHSLGRELRWLKCQPWPSLVSTKGS